MNPGKAGAGSEGSIGVLELRVTQKSSNCWSCRMFGPNPLWKQLWAKYLPVFPHLLVVTILTDPSFPVARAKYSGIRVVVQSLAQEKCLKIARHINSNTSISPTPCLLLELKKSNCFGFFTLFLHQALLSIPQRYMSYISQSWRHL